MTQWVANSLISALHKGSVNVPSILPCQICCVVAGRPNASKRRGFGVYFRGAAYKIEDSEDAMICDRGRHIAFRCHAAQAAS